MSNRPDAIARHRRSIAAVFVAIFAVWSSAVIGSHITAAAATATAVDNDTDAGPSTKSMSGVRVIRDATAAAATVTQVVDGTGGEHIHHRQFLVIDGNGSCPVTTNQTVRAQHLLENTADSITKFLPFIMSSGQQTQCYKHTVMYLNDLNDFKLWATKSEYM